MIAAECSKRYREVDREEVQKKENLRKKYRRELMKLLNPEANKQQLEKQIKVEAFHRKKKIEEAQEKRLAVIIISSNVAK